MERTSFTPTAYTLLAEAFCYPAPGRLEMLEKGSESLPSGSVKQALAKFLTEIRSLSLGEWEELHTRTLDLSPLVAPYVGFQVWGESYQRGVFLSQISREMAEHAIPLEGELPDHLVPVLRYLGQVEDPLPELVEVIDQALSRMIKTLRKTGPGNPYIHILEGVVLLFENQ
jgi:nitrate reductase molybdenum cofactor assembly chaperone NarJ/NarW